MPNSFSLVRTHTADDRVLDGAYFDPGILASSGVQACLLIHGTGSNFYAPSVLEIFAHEAAAAGLGVLRANTRGHDVICSLPGRGRSALGGAAYENMDDCRWDISAWLDWLAAAGVTRVAVVGHSMGGVKAMYSQAHAPHVVVHCLVALSPPRFCHTALSAPPLGDAFRREFELASQLVASGCGEQLHRFTQPLPIVMPAAIYVEKYGPEDRCHYLPCLSQLTCPILILLGGRSLETSSAFRGSDRLLFQLQPTLPRLSLEIIPQADISYTACPHLPFQKASAWWNSLS